MVSQPERMTSAAARASSSPTGVTWKGTVSGSGGAPISLDHCEVMRVGDAQKGEEPRREWKEARERTAERRSQGHALDVDAAGGKESPELAPPHAPDVRVSRMAHEEIVGEHEPLWTQHAQHLPRHGG